MFWSHMGSQSQSQLWHRRCRSWLGSISIWWTRTWGFHHAKPLKKYSERFKIACYHHSTIILPYYPTMMVTWLCLLYCSQDPWLCFIPLFQPPIFEARVSSGVPPTVGLFPIKVSTRNMQTGVEMAAGHGSWAWLGAGRDCWDGNSDDFQNIP